MTITQELIERVERASGAHWREIRALAKDVFRAVDLPPELSNSSYGWREDDSGWWLETGEDQRTPRKRIDPPHWLTSLDAAMNLLPEGWWLYAVDASIEGRFVVSLRGPLMAVEYEDSIARISDMMIPAMAAGIANSLATAITAASLRARMVHP